MKAAMTQETFNRLDEAISTIKAINKNIRRIDNIMSSNSQISVCDSGVSFDFDIPIPLNISKKICEEIKEEYKKELRKVKDELDELCINYSVKLLTTPDN